VTPSRRDLLRLLATMPAALALTSCRADSPSSPAGTGTGADTGVDGSTPSPPETPTARRVPEPLAMIRTSWSADPWARGSYSFLPVGADPALRAALAQPIDGRLFFAGEATSATAPATVHGALESGRRVAAEVGPDCTQVIAEFMGRVRELALLVRRGRVVDAGRKSNGVPHHTGGAQQRSGGEDNSSEQTATNAKPTGVGYVIDHAEE
jgi:hypothetical protein